MIDPFSLFCFFLGAALAACPALYFHLKFKTSLSRKVRGLTETAASIQKAVAGMEGEKRKLSAIVEHIAEGVFAVDREKQIVTWNAAAAAIFGVSKNSALGRSALEVVRQTEVDEMIDEVLARPGVIHREIALSFPEKKFLKAHAAGMRDGENGGAIVVLYDMSEIRRLESLRRDFVANVSHELRTPLTSLKGFIETLLGGAVRDPARSESFLKMMEEDTNRLTRLIDDLLELSSIESREVLLKMTPLDLGSELQKALALFEPRIREKNLTVKNLVPLGKFEVPADPDKLKQIFVNLLDNAVKFNREGGEIILSAHAGAVREPPLQNREICFSIQDTGIGIPQKSLPQIFERFYRVDDARSRQLGGTGLGLAIVKHLAELHGGRAAVESKPGEGSAFSIFLPQKVKKCQTLFPQKASDTF